MIRKIFTLSLFLLTFVNPICAQQYHAVLITGGGPFEESKPDPVTNDMFWNDTFLMWETLRNNGYDPNNIHVLYYNGEDYANAIPRYTPVEEDAPVTDSNSVFLRTTALTGHRLRSSRGLTIPTSGIRA